MQYILGTDEAGYGPTLGPLLVGSSLWELPDDLAPSELAAHLATEVVMTREMLSAASRIGRVTNTPPPLLLADSKVVYTPARGVTDLEQSIFALLAMSGDVPRDWHTLWQRVAPDWLPPASDPWHQDIALALPLEAGAAVAKVAGAHFATALAARSIQLHPLRAVAVFPQRFNALVAQLGNKATLLSHCTLELARQSLDALAPARALVSCDKHGGRSSYASIIQQVFGVPLVRTIVEGRYESRYTCTYRGEPLELVFLAKGESQLPTAVASMLAKYLREVAMIPLNQYWQAAVPGLRATAGYPEDAKRFLAEIAAEKVRRNVNDDVLIRCR